jgi:hypothetical protein
MIPPFPTDPKVEFRQDGIYLVWQDGRAVGPFKSISEARDCLDQLENQSGNE